MILKQLPLDIAVDAPRTFASYTPGANAVVVEHLRRLEPRTAPLYLWGPAGSGKTHLLEALVHERGQRGERVGWFSAATALPWGYDDAWSLLVFDDCDALDPAAQHAAFTLFIEATEAGVPVAAAGRVPPVDLPVRDDLRTRLAWGPVFAVEPLGEADTRATLRRAADLQGLFLSDEVMGYLLSHFERDLKHLHALLERLNRYALAQRRPVTVPLIKQMLADE